MKGSCLLSWLASGNILMRTLLQILLLASVALQPAWGEEVFVPEPAMINSFDPYPLDPGVLEIGPGYTFTSSNRAFDSEGALGPSDYSRQHSCFTEFTYGVTEGVDVRLLLGDVHGVDHSSDLDGDGHPDKLAGRGIGDVEMGVRWQFYQGSDGTAAVAFLSGLALPSGPEAGPYRLELTQGFPSLTPRLVASKSWGRFQVLGDVGVTLPLGRHESRPRGGLDANLGLGYQVGDHLKPLVELNYSKFHFSGQPASEDLSLTAGLVVMFSDSVYLNLGLQRSMAGRNSPESNSGVFFLSLTP